MAKHFLLYLKQTLTMIFNESSAACYEQHNKNKHFKVPNVLFCLFRTTIKAYFIQLFTAATLLSCIKEPRNQWESSIKQIDNQQLASRVRKKGKVLQVF